MKLLATIAIITISLAATGQSFPAKKIRWDRTGLTYYPYTYLDTEYLYSDTTGIRVIVQNSLRRAGGTLDSSGKKGYTNSSGERFNHAIYWTRVINESAASLELEISFPADSFAIYTSPAAYLKLFLPADTMTLEKEVLYNYGLTDLKSFLDDNFHNLTSMQRTIKPKEAILFYLVALTHKTNGVDRAEFVVKGQELFYRIDGVDIPCGMIIMKN